jgi:hypothetical protein
MARTDYFTNPAPADLADTAIALSEAVEDEHQAEKYLRVCLKDHKDASWHSPVDITDWPFIVDAAHKLVESRRWRVRAEEEFAAILDAQPPAERAPDPPLATC